MDILLLPFWGGLGLPMREREAIAAHAQVYTKTGLVVVATQFDTCAQNLNVLINRPWLHQHIQSPRHKRQQQEQEKEQHLNQSSNNSRQKENVYQVEGESTIQLTQARCNVAEKALPLLFWLLQHWWIYVLVLKKKTITTVAHLYISSERLLYLLWLQVSLLPCANPCFCLAIISCFFVGVL